MKEKTAESCGFNSVKHTLDESVSFDELESVVKGLNADPTIDGISCNCLCQTTLTKRQF